MLLGIVTVVKSVHNMNAPTPVEIYPPLIDKKLKQNGYVNGAGGAI
jgi:hypothetical protein